MEIWKRKIIIKQNINIFQCTSTILIGLKVIYYKWYVIDFGEKWYVQSGYAYKISDLYTQNLKIKYM